MNVQFEENWDWDWDTATTWPIAWRSKDLLGDYCAKLVCLAERLGDERREGHGESGIYTSARSQKGPAVVNGECLGSKR